MRLEIMLYEIGHVIYLESLFVFATLYSKGWSRSNVARLRPTQTYARSWSLLRATKLRHRDTSNFVQNKGWSLKISGFKSMTLETYHESRSKRTKVNFFIFSTNYWNRTCWMQNDNAKSGGSNLGVISLGSETVV